MFMNSTRPSGAAQLYAPAARAWAGAVVDPNVEKLFLTGLKTADGFG